MQMYSILNLFVRLIANQSASSYSFSKLRSFLHYVKVRIVNILSICRNLDLFVCFFVQSNPNMGTRLRRSETSFLILTIISVLLITFLIASKLFSESVDLNDLSMSLRTASSTLLQLLFGKVLKSRFVRFNKLQPSTATTAMPLIATSLFDSSVTNKLDLDLALFTVC